jgi:hypothetical protein
VRGSEQVPLTNDTNTDSDASMTVALYGSLEATGIEKPHRPPSPGFRQSRSSRVWGGHDAR